MAECMDITNLFDGDDWFARDLDAFIAEFDEPDADGPADEEALLLEDIELASSEAQRGHRHTGVTRNVTRVASSPTPEQMSADKPSPRAPDADAAPPVVTAAPVAAAAPPAAAAALLAPLLAPLICASPDAARHLAAACAAGDPGAQHALSRARAKDARAYRKARLLEKRRQRKTKGHTHYADRRAAAQARTRVGGRFQKKHHGTWQSVDERKAAKPPSPPATPPAPRPVPPAPLAVPIAPAAPPAPFAAPAAAPAVPAAPAAIRVAPVLVNPLAVPAPVPCPSVLTPADAHFISV